MQNLIRALVAASIFLNVSSVVSSSSSVRSDDQKTSPLELTHRFKLPGSDLQNLIRALVAASIFLNVSSVVSSSSSVRSDDQKTSPLELTHRFKLPGSIKGHFDHFAVDAKHTRLFATAVDDKAVGVFDV